MCIDLYVDKLLVYSNCIYSPSSSPSPNINPSPATDVGNILETPSAIPIMNTTNSPSSSSLSSIEYDTVPSYTPLPDHSLTIALILLSVIIPCIGWFICACRKKKKVQPPKKQKKTCCSKKTSKERLPTSERDTQTN